MRLILSLILILQLIACTAPQNEKSELYTAEDLPANAAPRIESGALHSFSSISQRIHSSHKKQSYGAGWGAMDQDFNTEAYDTIQENGFHKPERNPFSTFSVDVDTASYANIRRLIRGGSVPMKDAVRVEEMINYFDYADAPPTNSDPFAVHFDSAKAPWNSKNQVVRIALKGREMPATKRPASNLVFLIDTSGSMEDPEKLPLLRESFKLLVKELRPNDRVAIVVYAGAAGLVLPPTRGDEKRKILAALDELQAGGSTNGGAGIELAYRLAEENFVKGGVNRVLLATDGDFNVGVTHRSGLIALAKVKARKNIYLSVLGFGMGNLKDGMMEELSRKAAGNYSYIDGIFEAKKVLVEQISGTLVTIAKDVKIQVEFNPKHIAAYRLIGYENRLLRDEDFNDDKKDAGEIGAGHTVTALYEIIPAGQKVDVATVDELKYQKTGKVEFQGGDEWMNVKVRFKKPDGDVSAKLEKPYTVTPKELKDAGEGLRFATAVAAFGQILRDSEYVKEGDLAATKKQAAAAVGNDPQGYRAEFVKLVEETIRLKRTEASL